MRVYFFIASFLIPLHFTIAQVERGYQINGYISGLKDGSRVFMVHYKSTGLDTIASSTIKDQQFQFKGRLEVEGELFFIRLDTAISAKSKSIFLANTNIKMKGDVSGWPGGISIEGSEATNVYEQLLNTLSDSKKVVDKYQDTLQYAVVKMENIRQNIVPYSDTTLIRSMINKYTQHRDKYLSDYYKVWTNYIDDHTNSLYIPHTIIKLSTHLSANELEAIYMKLPQQVKESFYGQQLNVIINNQKGFKSVQVGAPAPDFTSITPQGNMVSLKEVVSKNKLTLVDFWGSWCKPCREETPNIRKVYEAFHDRGFNVLGVSLEFNKAAWVKAINDENLPWTIVSQIKGRDEAAAKLYNVNGVPAYLLIDNAGNIVAIDLPGSEIPSAGGSLRGEELYTLIESILNKKQ